MRLLDEFRHEDAELRGDVLQALMLDTLVPSSIDATVEDGGVTLTGRVDWQFQRDEAEFVAANTRAHCELPASDRQASGFDAPQVRAMIQGDAFHSTTPTKELPCD
jgi:osmotically-inducible protein OsmY